MTDNRISAARRAELTAKYISNPPPGAVAAAEQLSRAVLDARRDVEAWNAALGLAWLNWRTPPSIGMRCDEYMDRLREGQARQSRDPVSTFVAYHDDRNSHDVDNGWVAYEPDAPGHQNVALGHVLSERVSGTMTVHVLRAGTGPGLFDAREHLGRYERPSERVAPHADLPDFGPGYSVARFLDHAKRASPLRACDVRLDEFCRPHGIGGGVTQIIAIAQGRNIFAVNICRRCLDAAEPCGRGECDGYSAHD